MSESDSDSCDFNEFGINDEYPYFKQLIQENEEDPTCINLLRAKNEDCNERKLGKKYGRKKKITKMNYRIIHLNIEIMF